MNPDTDTVAVHAAHPSGAPGVLLLLWRPDEDGRVAFRDWSSSDWLAPGIDGSAEGCKIWDRIARWKADGWVLSEPAERLAAWLRGNGR